jgi:hypothetical protein
VHEVRAGRPADNLGTMAALVAVVTAGKLSSARRAVAKAAGLVSLGMAVAVFLGTVFAPGLTGGE